MKQTTSAEDAYDFIIVGAGTAGCVLAESLTRDRLTRVLLIEAGPWDKSPLIAMPTGLRRMTTTKAFFWDDMSEPDAELGGRKNWIPHGKVIGGGSSVNYMAHTRAHPADFDIWQERGAIGWGFADMLPYYLDNERWSGSPSAWRGTERGIGAVKSPVSEPIYESWFRAVEEAGLSRTGDYNGIEPEGFDMLQFSIRDGRRSSTAREYLHPAMRRGNLTVITDATVEKVLFDGNRTTGVEYVTSGRRRSIVSTRMTVLSGGAINTPHLLMLSGIGPAEHLQANGVTPIANLPVGQGLEDHLGFILQWDRLQSGALHRSMRMDRAGFNMLRSVLTRSGPLAGLPGVIVGFAKSRPDLAKADLQFFLHLAPPAADVWLPGLRRAYKDGFVTRVQLSSQQSRGTIRLRGSDPSLRPEITYNSLTASEDLVALRQGFKFAYDIGSAQAMVPYRGKMIVPPAPLESDDEIDAFIRATAAQQYHPACTCAIGRVLNPDLTVKGIEGLGVVDASAMPSLTTSNPNITIAAMAARAGDIWTGRTSLRAAA